VLLFYRAPFSIVRLSFFVFLYDILHAVTKGGSRAECTLRIRFSFTIASFHNSKFGVPVGLSLKQRLVMFTGRMRLDLGMKLVMEISYLVRYYITTLIHQDTIDVNLSRLR